MAAEDNDDEVKDPGEQPKKKIKIKLPGFAVMLPKILVLLNLIGMGFGGYLAYLGTLGMTMQTINEAKAKELIYNEEIFEGEPVTYSLESFTVNLGDTDQERIVQVKVTLELLDEKGFEEVVSMGAHARDTIVQILNGKQFMELQSIQGKLFLKDEITVALNQQLRQGFIKDVYFSRFVLQ